MEYRVLGRTGLKVSRLCLGTMGYGRQGFWKVVGTLAQEEVEAQLSLAVDAGVNFFDTANVYHRGDSEALLGAAIRKLGLPRHELVLATKVRGAMGDGPNDLGLSRYHIFHQVEDSLRRLQTDHIDLYQIHGFDPLTPMDEMLRALDDLVRSGRVRYLGVSNHAAWQIMKALGISAREGLARFESVQAYYSIAGRDLEREIVPLCEDQDLSILVWSPLAGGLLSGKFHRDASGPDGARRTSFDFPPVDLERVWACVDAMREIAAAHDCSVARVALAYCLHKPALTCLIVGARSEAQLADDLAAVDLHLASEEMRRLDEVSALPSEYPGWMIERQSQARTS